MCSDVAATQECCLRGKGGGNQRARFEPASPMVVILPLVFCSSGALSVHDREGNFTVTFLMPSQFSFLFKMCALWVLGQRTG